MTIIAHLQAFSVPALLGDLLISTNTLPGEEVDIPASRNINERIFLPPNYYVAGLRQKVVLLNDTLAIAWAGDFKQAVNFFATVEPLRRLNQIDPTIVQSIIDGIDQDQKDRLSLIGMVAAGDVCALITHRASSPQDFGRVSSVVCAGSGKDEFLEIVKQHSENIGLLNENIPDVELAKGFDLNLVSALSGEEFVSTLPLRRGWGGAFEIARQVDGKINKLRNLLFINFFIDNRDEEPVLWWVPNFRHLDYWRNFIVIQAFEHEVDSNGNFARGRSDVFIVGPPERNQVDLSAFLSPSVDQPDAVLTYILMEPGRDSASAVTYAAAYEKPAFKYDVSATLLKVHFDRMFMDDLLTNLGKMLGQGVRFGGARNRPD